MSPRVSVIIPAYNTERYVVRAVESALGQTERDLEVIVVDDASTDRTAEMVRAIRDERVRLLSCRRNLGPGGARNRGLEAAAGEWVALLDSDDWYAPDRLERLIQHAEASGADLVSDDVYLTRSPDSRPWNTLFGIAGERFDAPREISAPEFVESNLPGQRRARIGLTKPVMRRKFLGRYGIRYDEKVWFGEDFIFYLTCLARGARFVVVPEAHYFYLSRPGSLVAGDRLGNLEKLCAANRYALRQELFRRDPGLVDALEHRQRVIEQRIGYYRVAQPLKRGELAAAARELRRNPGFVPLLARQVPRILRYRFGRLKSGWRSST
ncbi:glycosyltransferase family 2 protein [Rubrobacter taiwanensis]|uniref:Glycosyltransferase family 2 protein n=1 Tax=Rubrobacter taiwanensis TaxID=185139 RepID=A0A4R1BDS2_9ACTN|nr:glycosyltransferase family 2 protein [Rubrobacter taiwanensis]TCJ15265.1 glycosyltransferase family 2 protein [Rubrobacter taiwanensis]